MTTKAPLLVLATVILAGSSAFAALPNFSTSVFPWLSAEGLTKYTIQTDFRESDYITRGEAAKFVAQYAALEKLPKTYTECTFSDLAGYDETLLVHIQAACEYGLLKGSNGKFMPNDNITEAQAITVVIRSMEGFKNETATPRYSEYFLRGKARGMITTEAEASVDRTLITRGKLGIWFYVAANGGADLTSDLDAMNEDELNDILEETLKELFEDDEEMTVSGSTSITAASNGYITTYDGDDVETALEAGQDVVLFFYTSSCTTCQTTDTALKAENDFPDNLVIFKVNYETATSLKNEYTITAPHTFVRIDANMSAKATRTGSMDLDDIVDQMD